MKDDSSHDLDVIVPFAKHSPRSFPCKRKCFRKQLIKTLAVLYFLLPFRCDPGEILVAEGFCPSVFLPDILHNRAETLHVLVVFGPPKEGCKEIRHRQKLAPKREKENNSQANQ